MKNSIISLTLIGLNFATYAGTVPVEIEICSPNTTLSKAKGILTIASSTIVDLKASFELSLNNISINNIYKTKILIPIKEGSEEKIVHPKINFKVQGLKDSGDLAICNYEGDKISNLEKLQIYFNHDYRSGGKIDLISNPGENKYYATLKMGAGSFMTFDQ